MQLVKLLTTLTLLVSESLTAAEDTTAIESQTTEPSSASASPSGFGAVLQHPLESLLRVVPHGQWIFGSKQEVVDDSVKMNNCSETSNSTITCEISLPPSSDKMGVHVHLNGDVITILGGYTEAVEFDEDGVHETLLQTRRFSKALRLPRPVKPEQIKAKMENSSTLQLEIERGEGPHVIKVE